MDCFTQQTPQVPSLMEFARTKMFEVYELSSMYEYFCDMVHSMFSEEEECKLLLSTFPDIVEETSFIYNEYPEDIWTHVEEAFQVF